MTKAGILIGANNFDTHLIEIKNYYIVLSSLICTLVPKKKGRKKENERKKKI